MTISLQLIIAFSMGHKEQEFIYGLQTFRSRSPRSFGCWSTVEISSKPSSFVILSVVCNTVVINYCFSGLITYNNYQAIKYLLFFSVPGHSQSCQMRIFVRCSRMGLYQPTQQNKGKVFILHTLFICFIC